MTVSAAVSGEKPLCRKVALLTNGTTETAWFLMRSLASSPDLECSFIVMHDPVRAASRIRLLIRSVLLSPVVALQKLLCRGRVYWPVLPMNLPPYTVCPDINAADKGLREFGADLILISGTPIVGDHIVNLAPVAVNLHHGYLPFYRGVSSVEWVARERNYVFFGATVHKAISRVDGGDVLSWRQVLPLPFEPYRAFRRRVMLEGAESLVAFARDCDAFEATPQPPPAAMPSRNLKHRDKPEDFVSSARQAFSTRNMALFALNHASQVMRFSRMVERPLFSLLRHRVLPPGLYVVNYHDICDPSEFNAACRVNSIYTDEERLAEHLRYYADYFQFVSLRDGLRLRRERRTEMERFLAVTVDDGLASIDRALALFTRYRVVPTLFINEDPLLNRRPLHNHRALLCARYRRRTGDRRDLDSVFRMMLTHGWEGGDSFHEFVQSSYLTRERLLMLARSSAAEIGSHSRGHAAMDWQDAAGQYAAIAESHELLERALGMSIPYFSYPYGKSDRRTCKTDYAAYRAAPYVFECDGGINQADSTVVPGPIMRIGIHNESTDALHRLLCSQWTR